MAGREKNCKWYFADQPNGQEVGPNNAMEQNFRQHPYASLIRESIQNSLDAVLDKSKPVRMVYSFRYIDGADYPEFFDLQNHIKGCLDYYPNNANAKALYKPMLDLFSGQRFHEWIGYIRVSDYNTKGMDYDEEKTDSPFYAFVRSAGVSAKENTSAGGSFGFGKAAYYLLSPISTIIVSTCTENYEKYFEGISSLCTHTYHGIKKMAVGYYDDNNGRPISEESDIPAQFRRSEPGTDINILGFDFDDKNEAIKEMTEAVLRNFWLAIFNNKLEVKIDKNVINKDNLVELMEEHFPDEDDIGIKMSKYNPRPYFDAVRLANSSNGYKYYTEELPLLGKVHLFINKQKGATDKIVYIRSIQMLVFLKRTKTNHGMYGVFFCDSEKGNDILRSMENPAHDEWKASNWRINGKINPKGRYALQELDDFIINCLNDYFISKDKTALNIKGLEDFLYIPTEYDEDEDLESESLIGDPTGKFVEDSGSYTTDIPLSDENPTVNTMNQNSSTGHIMINRTTTATNAAGGSLRSGHGGAKRKPKTKGIQKPGDIKEVRTEDENGAHGLFASPIYIPYRTFSQTEGGFVYHYVVLHSDNEVGNVRLHFYAVGEESQEELQLAETNTGNISGNIIRDVHISPGRVQLRVRFRDNMKHAIKLSAEELYEL